MTSRRHKIAFQVLFFLYIALLLFLCFGQFQNVHSVPRTILGIPSDKMVHFCMFFPFPILAFLAFDQYTNTVRQSLLFSGITFVVGILLALGTEWGQARLTRYRSGDTRDFLADSLALVLGTLIVLFWDIRKQKKKA
ncbi:MAG: VanZ family protein [Bacteroidales bacterium]|nr:VanZ family protein [Bacteroidales bacterium]